MNTPIRNFNLYNSRHEAYIAYKRISPPPIWYEDDGVNAFIVVDFCDWLWLPMRDSNKYTKEDENLYLNGNLDKEEL